MTLPHVNKIVEGWSESEVRVDKIKSAPNTNVAEFSQDVGKMQQTGSERRLEKILEKENPEAGLER